ncbi:hypothetical protein [Staphylococcus hominis]|nr:hypothetical protein [Staphylococcus hominis]
MQALTDYLTLTISEHTRELSVKLLPFILSYLQYQIDSEERMI